MKLAITFDSPADLQAQLELLMAAFATPSAKATLDDFSAEEILEAANVINAAKEKPKAKPKSKPKKEVAEEPKDVPEEPKEELQPDYKTMAIDLLMAGYADKAKKPKIMDLLKVFGVGKFSEIPDSDGEKLLEAAKEALA